MRVYCCVIGMDFCVHNVWEVALFIFNSQCVYFNKASVLGRCDRVECK